MRFDGRRWKTVATGSLLLEDTKKSLIVLNRPMIDGKDFWLTGAYVPDFTNESAKDAEVFLLHRGNGKWKKERIDPALDVNVKPVSDGRGGLWLLARRPPSDGDAASTVLFLHRTAAGRWNERLLGNAFGGDTAISDFVRLPGTRRLLGVGRTTPARDGNDASVFDLP